jgi:hypothetical protein
MARPGPTPLALLCQRLSTPVQQNQPHCILLADAWDGETKLRRGSFSLETPIGRPVQRSTGRLTFSDRICYAGVWIHQPMSADLRVHKQMGMTRRHSSGAGMVAHGDVRGFRHT